MFRWRSPLRIFQRSANRSGGGPGGGPGGGESGAVAIEAAILIPALMIAILVIIDVVRYITAATHVDVAASTAADLASRSEDVVDQTNFNAIGANNELAMFFFSANQAAIPSDMAADGQVILTAVQPGVGGNTVLWQRTGPYTFGASSRVGDLPELPASGTFVVAEAFLRFRPLVLETLNILNAAKATIYRRAVFRPRKTALDALLPSN